MKRKQKLSQRKEVSILSKMNLRSILTPLLIALFLGLSGVSAQEVVLDPVTITTSLVEKRTSETGRNITVIRGEELKDLPVNSIDELLRYLPGLEIQARGPMGSQSDISLRGGTFQQILVVLDGLRINDPVTGHFSSYIPISPSEISRIEILKGASSSVYGSEAVGGVVSIVTKTFEKNVSTKNQLEGSITGGDWGLWKANLGGYWQNDKFAISGGLLSNNADGPMLRGMRGYFHNHTASISARSQTNENGHIAFRSSYDQRDFAAQNFYTVFASDTATEKVSSWLQQLDWRQKVGTSVFNIRTGYKKTTDHYVYNSGSTPNHNVSTLLQGLATWQKQLAPSMDVVVGLHYQRRAIQSNDRGDHALQQWAPFVIGSYRLHGFSIDPSVRFDWRENIGTEVIPQLNLSYKLQNWQIRSSVGKTIRDADFTERFNNYNKEVVTGGSIGNPDLKAERSVSYEVGLDWFSGGNWKVSTTYFQRHQGDVIDYVPTPWENMPRQDNLLPSGSYALAQNIAKVVTKGWEADIQYQRKTGDQQRLLGMMGITILGSQQSLDIASFYLSSHAKLLLNGMVHYRYKRLQLSVNGLYKVREPRDASGLLVQVERSYFTLNFQTGFDLIPSRLSAYLQVDNLTDARYSDLLGAVMPGRWVMGGIKFNFSRD